MNAISSTSTLATLVAAPVVAPPECEGIGGLVDHLESTHLAKEERVLFPAIRELVA